MKIEEEGTGMVWYRSLDELIERMTWVGFTDVQARRLVRQYGLGRCEGATLKTLCEAGEGGKGSIRRPTGWTIATLQKGLQWTPDEIRQHQSR